MPEESPQLMQTLLSADPVGAAAPAAETDAAAVDSEPSSIPGVGDFIGRYRIRDHIGEGGMGVVYAAEDPELGRIVAIKLLRPVQGSEAEVHQRRLLREAQALARVSHRNLVTVFDVGTHEGRVWVAMEYVEGDTLEDWLARERRAWREIVDVFIEAGGGLAAVHEAGLVHRDFKPGNVIVGSGGTVQVLDFGLAAQAGDRITEEAEQDRARARPAMDALAATLTETGGIMGTPAYMAPEQFLRLGADARADQFSFCVALYEALYGHRPFKGKDLAELMLATVEGLPDRPPPLPGLPDAVRSLLVRGLSKEPDRRYPDMHALVEALQDTRTRAEPRSSGGWRRFVLGVVVGGGLLAAGLGAWLANTEPSDASDAAGMTAPPELDVPATPTDTEAPEPLDGDGSTAPDENAALPVPEPTTDRIELPGLEDLEDPVAGSTGVADTGAMEVAGETDGQANGGSAPALLDGNPDSPERPVGPPNPADASEAADQGRQEVDSRATEPPPPGDTEGA